MSFTDAIKSCFQKFATISGRARRSEYWFWYLFTTIVSGLATWIQGSDHYGLTGIVGAVFLIPGLAVAVRRMHDAGRSGWYLLMSLIPLVGWIFVLVALCTDSVPGTNAYGENPKGQRDPAYAPQTYAAPAEAPYETQAQEAVFTEVKEEEPINSSNATTTGFCPYCDNPITVGQRYCTGCGHRLDV